MREPSEDNGAADEDFLLRHSSRSTRSSSGVNLDQVREQLALALELSRTGSNAVDLAARSFALGRASAFEEAINILDKALQAEQSGRNKKEGQDPKK